MIAATEIGFVRMRVSKVVRLSDEDDFCEFVVLNELDGDRHLVIRIGSAEAFALAAGLGDVEWGRPMTYQFMAELVRSLGGASARSGSTPWSRGPRRPGRRPDRRGPGDDRRQ
jgi:hypothetical protein